MRQQTQINGLSLKIRNAPLTFKIDTGADATVISERTFQRLPKTYRLGPSETPFVGPGGELQCIGWCTANTNILLSQPEAVKMGLVKWVEHVRSVFGTSCLLKTEPVKIILKKDAQPYAVHTARCVLLPLMPLV